MKSELRIGIRMESEHKDLVKYLRGYVKRHKTIPSPRKIYKKISEAHIRENPKYYTKLRRAKL